MQHQERNSTDTFISRALWIWLGTTAFFIVSNTALFILSGARFYSVSIQAGPYSLAAQTLTSVALTWLSLGAALLLLKIRTFRLHYGFPTVCALLVALLYINICRERTHCGDAGTYFRAAKDLANGTPFRRAYLYPPLLATLLEPLVRFGPMVTEGACWVANILSLIAFFGLLTATLHRYGFSQRFSSLVTLLFMVVNVPIMRTLLYGQVNLHVTNMILIALLSYPGLPILSALALAIAVHLKASPMVLVLPFLLAKDRNWITWFAVFLLALASVTLVTHGFQPFRDFVTNVSNVYNTTGMNFRQNSVDSLVRSTAMLLGIPLGKVFPMIAALKGMLLLFLLAAMSVCLKRRTFQTEGPGRTLINATPALLLFMLIASPLMWEHHPVFVALPFLVVIRKLNTQGEWLLYGFAYFLEYLVPTFDFFPWSFGRLLSPIMMGALLYKVAARVGSGTFFLYAEHRLKLFCNPTEGNPANHRVEVTR
jgi:hypothetical protein